MPTSVFVSDGPLGELYRCHRRAIHRHCRRLLNNGEAAEDATQETFLRACRHIGRAPGPDEVLRWLYRIATNYCLNELRSRRNRARLVAALAESPLGSGSLGDPVSDRVAVRRIAGQLPHQLQTVAYLHHLHGYHQQEVAMALGISRRTVVTRLAAFHQRARKVAGVAGNEMTAGG